MTRGFAVTGKPEDGRPRSASAQRQPADRPWLRDPAGGVARDRRRRDRHSEPNGEERPRFRQRRGETVPAAFRRPIADGSDRREDVARDGGVDRGEKASGGARPAPRWRRGAGRQSRRTRPSIEPAHDERNGVHRRGGGGCCRGTARSRCELDAGDGDDRRPARTSRAPAPKLSHEDNAASGELDRTTPRRNAHGARDGRGHSRRGAAFTGWTVRSTRGRGPDPARWEVELGAGNAHPGRRPGGEVDGRVPRCHVAAAEPTWPAPPAAGRSRMRPVEA